MALAQTMRVERKKKASMSSVSVTTASQMQTYPTAHRCKPYMPDKAQA